ncbi:MAG: helix-turn-helix domain-containing protein [Bacteroidales bacterium]
MDTIYIKNMVCDRCIFVVRTIFAQHLITIHNIRLGEVEIVTPLTSDQQEKLRVSLEEVGFEVMDNRRSKLIEQIKSTIRELVHRHDCALKVNISDYLSEHLNHDYSAISSLFSEVEGTTVEKFYIAQKIERVKELLVYDDLSLSEIALRLNYSSTAHLSNQFKKVTGLTPTFYKQLTDKRRQPLDKI